MTIDRCDKWSAGWAERRKKIVIYDQRLFNIIRAIIIIVFAKYLKEIISKRKLRDVAIYIFISISFLSKISYKNLNLYKYLRYNNSKYSGYLTLIPSFSLYAAKLLKFA